jgi:hypothetical protein
MKTKQQIKLFMREYHVAGYNGYHAVAADFGAATIWSGITKKLAGTIIGIISNEINQFCRINRLATLLADLETIRPLLDKTPFKTTEECNALLRISAWVNVHQDGKNGLTNDPTWATENPERIAYLSLDNERYDAEEQQRKLAQKV